MSVADLVSRLRDLDVRLAIDGDRLRCSAPAGVLTHDLRAELEHRKPELLQYLRGTSGDDWPGLRPRTGDRPALLSFAQERLWFLEQFGSGAGTYIIAEAVWLHGLVDLVALERSLNAIVARHETLRSNYREEDGRAIAVIEECRHVRLQVCDLSSLPAAERHVHARRLVAADANAPFDIAHGPLARFTLLRLGHETAVALIAIHHIICDGWSLGVLMQELSVFYNAFSSGTSADLPPLSVQYRDYAAWQRERLQGRHLDNLVSFWRHTLADLPVQDFPTDHRRPRFQTFTGAQVRRRIARPTADALRELSRSEGATLFMTMLAPFAGLLARYLDSDDVVVLTRMAGRPTREVEGLIGLFLNSLILRVDVSGNPTFREAVARTRRTCVEAYAHEELSFEYLAKTFAPERDPGRQPFAQVMIALHNYPQPRLALRGLDVRPFEIDQVAAWLDLDLSLIDSADGLDATLTYNTDLFEPTTIERFLRHFVLMLDHMAANPDRRLADVALPADDDVAVAQLQPLQQPAASDSDTLRTLFEAQVDRTPDAVALIFGSTTVSFAELNRAANRIARVLRASGVKPEVSVAVCLESPLHRAIALVAILKAGGVYVSLDPTHPESYRAEIVRATGARIVIDEAAWSRFSGEKDDDQAHAGDCAFGPKPANLAYLMCTSGSTGSPKPVAVTHAALLNRLAWTWHAWPFAAGEVACQRSACSFAASLYELLGPLLQGRPTLLLARHETQEPAALVDALQLHGVTRVMIVPSLLAVLLDSERDLAERLPRLTLWITLGERLSDALCRTFHERLPHARLWSDYGATEITAVAFQNTLGAEGPRAAMPIGAPVANTTIHILDSRLRPVPAGVVGEICVASHGLARGYVDRPDLTAEKFLPNPLARRPGERFYRTGDVGRRLSDGRIEHLGRRDEQVKIRGARVEFGAIEATLLSHEGVRQVAIVCEAGERGNRLTAYVVAAGPAPPTTDALQRHLERRLPDYMMPSQFVLVERFPMTVTGKVDRRALARLGGVHLGRETAYVAPRTDVERALSKAFGEVLETRDPGIYESFFRLGGDSILSVRLTARVRQIGYVITPRQIFQFPTIADLAGVAIPVEQAQDDAPAPAAAGDFPLARLTQPELDRFLASLAGSLARRAETAARAVDGEAP